MSDEIAKLRWRCRRGMKELDMLLTAYLDSDYPSATAEEKSTFEVLLEQQDPDLYEWFLGRSKSPNLEVQALIEKIGPRLHQS